MTQFFDAHVLVTGAASGLGRLMALEAVHRKARVTLLDRDAEGLERVREELCRLGGDASALVVDLADRAALQAVCAQVLAARGGVDILINNAGIVSGKPLLETSDEAIERTFQVNTLAHFWTVRAFLPGMVARHYGVIINMASVASSLKGVPSRFIYSASKAACEIAVASWRASFVAELPPLVTARAGNVIGGGDFAPTRLVPDLVRAADGAALVLRYPRATRPWQHVLDVLVGYLLLAERAVAGDAPAATNFAPPDGGDAAVLDIIAAFSRAFGHQLDWIQAPCPAPEAPLLALDAGLAASRLGWYPRLDGAGMVGETAAWYAAWRRGDDMLAHSIRDARTALA